MDIALYIFTFLGGILSIFSPCIFSLIPIYMSYLTFGAKELDESGKYIYKKKTVIRQTFCFITGICTTFFLLGFSFSYVGEYISDNNKIIQILGGILIVFLGLFQMEFFKIPFLKNEKRINFTTIKSSPFLAYITGVIFSFAWTPCVGPTLTSVLILVTGSEEKSKGIILISLYALGFIFPFILLGLFTSRTLEILKKYKNIVKYITKMSGVILILTGSILILKGRPLENNNNIKQKEYRISDQFGVEYSSKEIKQKNVNLIFLSTWCSICKVEMAYLNKISKERKDIKILGVMNPKTVNNPLAVDESISIVEKFISENEYTFPILLDKEGILFNEFNITAFPTLIKMGGNEKSVNKIVGGMSEIKLKEKLENIE